MKKTKRTTKLLAFAPALLMIGITAVVASGVSIVSGATAASTVAVTGNVGSSLSTSPGVTGGAGAEGCGDEALAAFATNFAASNGCTITFSSNNVNGAAVVFENNNVGVGQSEAFFCSDGVDGVGGVRSCATDTGRLDDLVGSGNTIAASDDAFGIALADAKGDAATVAGSGVAGEFAIGGLDGTDAAWSGIPANGAAVQLCRIPQPNGGSNSECQFAFGGAGEGGTQGAGDYTGTLSLTAGLL